MEGDVRMPLVQAKCTNCGATLEVDNAKEAAICPYCNSAYIVEKAINNYTTFTTNNNSFAGANINIVGVDAENYIKLANDALEARNGQEAFDYAKRALEIQPESSEGWIAKMKSIEFLGSIKNTRIDEAVSYGTNAIKYSADDQRASVEEIVYNHYLARAITLMSIAVSKSKDTDSIQKQVKHELRSNRNPANTVAKKDESLTNLYNILTVQSINLKLKVPESYFVKHADVRQNVVRLANLYAEFCKVSAERIGLYFQYYTEDALNARERNFGLLMQSLTESEKEQVNDSNIRTTNGQKKKGCYIATAVYGSYDCPQVWTLRRFRDYTLAETWYGRVFVCIYYAISPTLVKWFGHTEWFKKMWKGILDRMVINLNVDGVENTPYNDKPWR